MGAHCNIEHGCVVARAETLRGAEIQLEFPSVGATENILMAAVVAEESPLFTMRLENPTSSTCARC